MKKNKTINKLQCFLKILTLKAFLILGVYVNISAAEHNKHNGKIMGVKYSDLKKRCK